MRCNKTIGWVIVLGAAGIGRGEELLRNRVNDYARVMRPADSQQLERLLEELENKTGAQLVVLTVSTTGGRDIYEYGREVFNSAGRTRRGLGQKGENNGALVLVAVKDRKFHTFVGEGIEDEIPDLYSDQVAQRYFVPNFRAGNYSQGILQGVTVLAQKLAMAKNVTLPGVPRAAPARRSSGRRSSGIGGCFSFAILMIIVLSILGRGAGGFRRRRSGFWQGMILGNILSNMGGSSRGGFGGWSGGSGGGGWGGGFGGGGGGSFGGGGSGGSW